jgi:hypothetical protein
MTEKDARPLFREKEGERERETRRDATRRGGRGRGRGGNQRGATAIVRNGGVLYKM